ncbi:LysR family transcriptional regulator, glycine cleavage system transcriptional activator [Sphingomonas laterariae]|uniref:LysR family transcriptional regulator, glycine cleavage system transcriptional activator n=1 Tax=Edaphosphingomonas laterariae TaxID=861865 RepID=A0A239G6E0_9SPHN|nr:transcriptional regulator GcvA [Sphingomonas laterariae]SNS64232.1 LysR family transcriptional regulator, glycine cleavage system transcriptional activator [Sphingomonas laterariae]
MRRIPPLTAVRVFEAAARHENFTAAAQELGMTQAAVSYQIRLLEERLGVPLFARAKRRVVLTDAGRKVAPTISGAFDTLHDAFASLASDDAGVLKITCATTFASHWLAPRLGRFQMARPDLAVSLHAGNEVLDLAREEVDVGIRTGYGDWPGLRAHFLFRLHFTPVCSPAYLAAHPLNAPADLLAVNRLSPDDLWWKQWFAAAGVAVPDGPRRPGIRLDSQVLEASTAMAGHGAAIVSPLYLEQELAAGRLVQPFPLIAFEGPSFWLVHTEQRRNVPKIAAFRDWVLEEIAAQAALDGNGVFLKPAADERTADPL